MDLGDLVERRIMRLLARALRSRAVPIRVYDRYCSEAARIAFMAVRVEAERDSARRIAVALAGALRAATCTCGPRHPTDPIQLDNVPGHHDWGCGFRAAMQLVMREMARPQPQGHVPAGNRPGGLCGAGKEIPHEIP